MSPGENNRNLVILGMHRSGTSMVAGALSGALNAGEPEELLEPQADNPRGFFERRDVVALNDALLEAAGGSWFGPVADSVAAQGALAAQIQSIVGRMSSSEPWLLKDPRMILTWPAWEPRLGSALLLFVYRGPGGVANSLEDRNKLPLDHGLALWQYYNRRALEILREREFVAVSYERFAADPEAELDKLLARLREHGIAVESAQSGFDRRLDHTPGPETRIEGLLNPVQLALHEACLQVVDTGTVPELAPPGDPDLALRIASMSRAYAHSVDSRQVADELRGKTAELAASVARYDELHAEHAALAEAHRRDNDELAELRETHVRLSRELAGMTERAEYLFGVLELNYNKLLSFAESGLGRCYGPLAALYKLLTGQRGRSTAYEDVLQNAREYFELHPRPQPEASKSRLRLLIDVISYMLANPSSSIRSFSWPRLRRALGLFVHADERDLSLWVRQRFPASHGRVPQSMLPELTEDLDDLELRFTAVENPRVSIILPVYNHYRMTIFCLRSLLEHSADVSYEVILADDASTDSTGTIEQRVSGIVLERAGENRGFVRNCNAAAAAARGEYLLFLNNDTGLTPGWLSSLLATLEEHPGAGVVGPMLLYGNGDLQEAGGIVWDDASGWNYGRLDDRNLPQYNYLREVDYVSGACLLVRHSLWRQLGGFDTRFVPAYYEDTDLCFSARQAGYSVLYQPESVVFHFEGVTNGTDLDNGIKQYQRDNQAKFLDKWGSVLCGEHYPNGESLFRARDRSRGRRTVLVIDHYVPSFDRDAGSRSTWQYLQLLVEMGYNVKFMGANFYPHQPYTRALQQAGIEVLVGEPMARDLDKWLQAHAADIDTVYLHRPHVAEQFLPSLDKMRPRPTVVFFGHDLHYLRKQREVAVTHDATASREEADWREREYRIFQQVDHVYYPSQVEIDEILTVRPELSARAIPLYVMEDRPPPEYLAEDREGMLFVGGFNHPPNGDGVSWFVEEVLPRVRREAPALALHLVGSNMPREIRSMSAQGVRVHGYLDDAELLELYGQVKLVVVPLRFGAGVKGKVIEALQQGVPVVSTSVGAEGLPGANRVLHVADDAESFAREILAVDRGERAVVERLRNYSSYLCENFSKDRARNIIRRDFGEPCRESP